MKMPENFHHPASFRDPSGFVFRLNGVYYRQVQQSYAKDYEWLLGSNLYRELTEKRLLLSHREIDENLTGQPGWYKTLHPEQLELITYPYEWSFDQLRDAALHTLTVMNLAIGHGMILKDATPFNIQFVDGKPLFIDTLSFEKYDGFSPWIAYRQFCECFLFPLYLEHYRAVPLRQMLIASPDGIPAALTARLLGFRGRFNMGVWMHVHLQNIVKGNRKVETGGDEHGQKAGIGQDPQQGGFSKEKLRRLIQHFQSILVSLKPGKTADSHWSEYYGKTILSRNYLDEKEKIFRQFLSGISFGSALDLGANDGHFSEILAGGGKTIIAIDADARCINTLYKKIREKDLPNILPLCVDIANPTPAIGFRNRERSSFIDRVKAELVVALALIHHLVFGRSIPLKDIAGCFAELTTGYLLIEFVPLEDEKVRELIKHKKSFHLPYDEVFFEDSMAQHFVIEKKQNVPGTTRTLYLMKKIV